MMTAFSLLAASPLFAALVPLSPVDGQEVALVPDAQKTVMNRPTLEARIKMFKEDRRAGKTLKHDKFWRRSRPLVLEVRTASGEQGPWKVLVGKRADLSDARIWYLPADVRPGGGGAAKDVVRLEVPKANLEIATLYHWKVIGQEGGKDKKRTVETPVSSFVTEDFAPRWIVLDGPVGNVRDMGGRLGLGGRRVRQGLVYRGQGLNGCSVTGEAKGPNRLTVEDVDYLTGTLGIRTDLDLRSKEQIADLTSSPLGPSVKFIWHSSLAYADIFSEAGKRNMAENFRVFCDRGNYPVYFHCIMGADRTGSLAYVLNGVLGVSRHELETDWEATFYPEMPDENEDLKCWRRESHFNDGFAKYGDADTPWNDRIVLYLRDCGITDEEIAAFRGIMLEGPAFVSDLGSIVRAGEEKPAAGPVKIVFDTDMITDFDDVGALACLHAMADAGECEILATVSSTRGNASVAAIEVINAYYGRGDLPVGAPKGMGVLGAFPGAKEKVDPKSPLGTKGAGDGGHYKYRKLAADYPQGVRHLDADDAPDANAVYRRALAAAPDGSVVICTVGFLTNLRRLLETPPDDVSPLNGRELVARKVSRWVAMALFYPHGKEYNSMCDAESSRIVLENWPTPVVFSDFQYGYDVYAGRAVADQPGPRNPIKDVFAGTIPSREEVRADPAKWMRSCYGMGGRAAWDETAVLAAVRGAESYFNAHRGTYRMVGDAGEDEWVPDEANGPHVRLTEKTDKNEVGRIIDELICRGPRKK